MKINEMIKKIEGYNEVAEMIGTPKAELRVKIGFGFSIPVESMKAFRKHIRDEYIECVAEAILNCDSYEFGKEISVSVVDKFGDELHEEIEFFAE